MPRVRIHNRTKGSMLPNGVVVVIRAGVANGQGAFQGVPSTLDVPVDNFVYYDVPASPFRITAEPNNRMMKAGNWVQQKDAVKADIDVYIVTSNEDYGVEISVDEPAIRPLN